MADMTGGQKIGSNQGKGAAQGNGLENFLKVFGGEVLTAFQRRAVAMPNFMVRTIQNGKSASFPVLGRTSASYLAAGKSLDDVRKDIKHSEVVIEIDGLLTTDVLIYDIEDAMNHYDVRGEYSAQIGEALAIAADGAVLAEVAGLCNLPASTNENIAGLGKATILEIGATAAAGEPKVRGEAIIAQLTKARAALTKNYVPSADRKFYTTPDDYSAILAALMPNSANYAALIDPETGNIRNVVGFEIVEVPHLTAGGAGVGAAAHVLPLLRRCAVGGGHLSGKGRCTGHHLPGVPVSRAGKAGEKEKRKKEESVRRTEAQKGSPAPPEGEADPADRLHHLKRGGKAHPGHHRLPALHPDRRCPRCPGRRPCRGCPQLWQAERLALPDAGFPGPVPLSGL